MQKIDTFDKNVENHFSNGKNKKVIVLMKDE